MLDPLAPPRVIFSRFVESHEGAVDLRVVVAIDVEPHRKPDPLDPGYVADMKRLQGRIMKEWEMPHMPLKPDGRVSLNLVFAEGVRIVVTSVEVAQHIRSCWYTQRQAGS